MSADDKELVAIAKTLRTRGLRGELVSEVLTDFPERFNGLQNVTAILPDGSRRELEIKNSWFQKNRVILQFVGYASIEKAQTLLDAEICVSEEDAVDLTEDEFFEWELIGCTVETSEGEKIGKVLELMRTDAGEILVVQPNDESAKDFLIPFVGAICIEVDTENKIIRVELPEGILEW